MKRLLGTAAVLVALIAGTVGCAPPSGGEDDIFPMFSSSYGLGQRYESFLTNATQPSTYQLEVQSTLTGPAEICLVVETKFGDEGQKFCVDRVVSPLAPTTIDFGPIDITGFIGEYPQDDIAVRAFSSFGGSSVFAISGKLTVLEGDPLGCRIHPSDYACYADA